MADASAVPALAVGATGASVGGRLAGTHPVTAKVFAISIGYGPNMIGYAVEETAVGTAASAHCYARHLRGDTAYAIDNEAATQLYSVSRATWSGVAGLGATVVAVADNADDFSAAPSGGGAPDANWRAVQ
ncbi:MAG: hypothetical protein ACKVE4_12075 [Dissulfuribacterales bacterium]